MPAVPGLLADGARRLDSAAEARTLLAHAAAVEPSRLALLAEVDDVVAAGYAALVVWFVWVAALLLA